MNQLLNKSGASLLAGATLLALSYCGGAASNDSSDRAALAALPAFAAAEGQTAGQYGELTVLSHDDSGLSGSFRGGEVVFRADAAGKLSVTVNGKTLTASNEGDLIHLNGGGATLSAADKTALADAQASIVAYLEATFQTDAAEHERLLLALVDYWSEAPVDFPLPDVTMESSGAVAARGASSNEGVTCIRKGTTVQAVYDDSRGNHYENVVVGSKARSGYGCMGRCGGDCGSWWAASSWTKDCMDHDQCSHKNYSSGGSSDPNCGDEWNEAADDWIQGVWRGCRG